MQRRETVVPFTSESARAARARQSSDDSRRKVAQSWTPEARVRRAVKQLVDNAPALTPDQLARLRGILAPVLDAKSAKTGRGRAA